ncbi:MAG: hypothetical protein KAR06_02205 [Deltaproteobacteria bacterium]|nr:hypothetical protein [Deltaproteobacteria bacterium]
MAALRKYLAVTIIVVFAAGCASTIPKEALQLSQESLKLRQLQTRRFETKDEKTLLSAGAALLQDLGFIIDMSETKLGVIVASKDRSAVDAGEVIGSLIFSILFNTQIPIDVRQKLRASYVTRPRDDGKDTLVRITFQRMVWNDQGHISKRESIEDPKYYQEFFEKLSKATFLEANEL